jgi:hypothetical protein
MLGSSSSHSDPNGHSASRKIESDLRSEWAGPNADDITGRCVDACELTGPNYAGLHSLPRMRNLQRNVQHP